MSDVPFVIPLSSARAADVECVGPKAANLAALARAGLPTPGGFCLGADAYRRQVAELGMQDLLARYNDADVTERRRISVTIRLALYERPIAPAVLDPLLAAWRAQRADGRGPSAVSSSAPFEGPQGAHFGSQVPKLLV